MKKQIAGIAFSCAVALVFSGSASTSDPMVTKENRFKNEAAIQELIGGFIKAIRAKDINGGMSVFLHRKWFRLTSLPHCNMAVARRS